MLLPLYLIVHVLAVVVAKVADVIATVSDGSYFGRCYAKVADGMPTMGVAWKMVIAKVTDGMATRSIF